MDHTKRITRADLLALGATGIAIYRLGGSLYVIAGHHVRVTG